MSNIENLKTDLFLGVSREEFNDIVSKSYSSLGFNEEPLASALEVIKGLVRSGMCTGVLMNELTRPKVLAFYRPDRPDGRDAEKDELAACIMSDIIDHYRMFSGEIWFESSLPVERTSFIVSATLERTTHERLKREGFLNFPWGTLTPKPKVLSSGK
jgi:hypothetical protein